MASCERQRSLRFRQSRGTRSSIFSQSSARSRVALPQGAAVGGVFAPLRDTLAGTRHAAFAIVRRPSRTRGRGVGWTKPYIYALATYLNHRLPPWIPPAKGKDNGIPQRGASATGLVNSKVETVFVDDHFLISAEDAVSPRPFVSLNQAKARKPMKHFLVHEFS